MTVCEGMPWWTLSGIDSLIWTLLWLDVLDLRKVSMSWYLVLVKTHFIY